MRGIAWPNQAKFYFSRKFISTSNNSTEISRFHVLHFGYNLEPLNQFTSLQCPIKNHFGSEGRILRLHGRHVIGKFPYWDSTSVLSFSSQCLMQTQKVPERENFKRKITEETKLRNQGRPACRTFPAIIAALTSLQRGGPQLLNSAAWPSDKPGFLESSLDSKLGSWFGGVSEELMEKVLRQITEPNLAMAFFRWSIKQPNFNINSVRVYKFILGTSAKSADFHSVEWILGEMERHRLKPDLLMYTQLINGYSKNNLIAEAEKQWLKMKGEGLKLDVVAYGVMIDMYAKSGKYEEAMELHRQMEAEGVESDNVMLTILINMCVKTLNLRKARQIFSQMLQSQRLPSAVTWNSMINVIGKLGTTAEALAAFQAMKERGVPLSNVSYGSIIHVCGKAGMFSEVQRLLELMQRDGIKPDAFLLSTVIANYGRFNEVHRAARFFRDCVRQGVTPTTQCYNALIYVFFNAGMYKQGCAVLEVAKKRGIQPDLSTYVHLLAACTNCEDSESAGLLLAVMESSGVAAHGILRLLLRSEQEVDTWQRVGSVLRQCERERLDDRRAMADSLIDFLAKLGLSGRASRLWGMVRCYWANAVRYLDQQQGWKLDLHAMSERTAVVALCAEFAGLSEKSAMAEIPRTVRVVTGWGRGSRQGGQGVLRLKVEAVLEELQSPFVPDCKSRGSFLAAGPAVREWLAREEVRRKLLLKDRSVSHG